jgi:hypothetical protein
MDWDGMVGLWLVNGSGVAELPPCHGDRVVLGMVRRGRGEVRGER